LDDRYRVALDNLDAADDERLAAATAFILGA
jgi:hypothetical protein